MPSACLPRKDSGNIKQTPLQAQRAYRREANCLLEAALDRAKKAQRANNHGKTKRRENSFLARYLAVPLDTPQAIRPGSGYQARHYNRGKQVLGLIDHLFARYPVPTFLYRSILSPEGFQLVFDTNPATLEKEAKYLDWFFAVAAGESFAKTTRGFFTKREAHLFLQAPANNGIEQNIFWARAAAVGVAPDGCDFLLRRLDEGLRAAIGDRLPDLLRFYAEAWPRMTSADRDEITDFVRAMIRDPTFSFKARTFGSMRKLCQEWHQTVYRSQLVGAYRCWPAKLKPWEIKKDGIVIRADELTSSRVLSEEGQSQRHCVFSYIEMCVTGSRTIVSLRWYQMNSGLSLQDRLTIEVQTSTRQVVQIRGKLNRRATKEEMVAVRLWAGDQGLRIASGT